jgi:4'-phosphopantetheinyl transferase
MKASWWMLRMETSAVPSTEPDRGSNRSRARRRKEGFVRHAYCVVAAVLIPSTASIPSPGLSQQAVHVWFCDLSRHEPERAALAALLSTEEHNRAARFAFDRDRQRFTLSHGLLRLILARYVGDAAGQLQFEAGVHGKPALLRRSPIGQAIEFSLSHSGQYAAVAVADGRAVGVDIEVCRPDVDALTLAQRFFAPGESQRIAQAHGDEQPRTFYCYWTGKEAYLKGRGVGLSFGLDRFELLFDQQLMQAQVRVAESGILDRVWSVQSLQLGEHLAGAIAVEGEAWQMQLFDATTLIVTPSPAV